MTCLEAEELLLEAIDDTLAAPVRRALDGHLATCSGVALARPGSATSSSALVRRYPSARTTERQVLRAIV